MSARRQAVDIVPNRRLREVVLERIAAGRTSYNEIALACGWGRGDRRGADASRVRRKLGVAPWSGDYWQSQLEYDVAVLICRAAGIDPWEADL